MLLDTRWRETELVVAVAVPVSATPARGVPQRRASAVELLTCTCGAAALASQLLHPVRYGSLVHGSIPDLRDAGVACCAALSSLSYDPTMPL